MDGFRSIRLREQWEWEENRRRSNMEWEERMNQLQAERHRELTSLRSATSLRGVAYSALTGAILGTIVGLLLFSAR